jgi:hypothetical protein
MTDMPDPKSGPAASPRLPVRWDWEAEPDPAEDGPDRPEDLAELCLLWNLRRLCGRRPYEIH